MSANLENSTVATGLEKISFHSNAKECSNYHTIALSILAWKIPWTEEPGKLQFMGSLRVGHNWATSLSFSLSSIGEGNGNPLQYSCLENPRDEGGWWAAIYGVAQSRTRLKRLSSSSSKKEAIWEKKRQSTWTYISLKRYMDISKNLKRC